MACFVYVLAGLSGTRRVTYVGWTLDLARRVDEHNGAAPGKSRKGAKSTRGKAWTLVYAEKYQTRSEAMSREAKLKRDNKFRTALRQFVRARESEVSE